MAKYNWDEIRAKFETGKYTIKELAEEYGFHYEYGCRKARENGWEKGKSSEKVHQETLKKMVEKEANKEAELREEYEKIINNIRRGAYKTLFQDEDFERLKQFKIASEIMRNLRREQWEVNQIKEVAEKVESKLSGKIEVENTGGSVIDEIKKYREAISGMQEKGSD